MTLRGPITTQLVKIGSALSAAPHVLLAISAVSLPAGGLNRLRFDARALRVEDDQFDVEVQSDTREDFRIAGATFARGGECELAWMAFVEEECPKLIAGRHELQMQEASALAQLPDAEDTYDSKEVLRPVAKDAVGPREQLHAKQRKQVRTHDVNIEFTGSDPAAGANGSEPGKGASPFSSLRAPPSVFVALTGFDCERGLLDDVAVHCRVEAVNVTHKGFTLRYSVRGRAAVYRAACNWIATPTPQPTTKVDATPTLLSCSPPAMSSDVGPLLQFAASSSEFVYALPPNLCLPKFYLASSPAVFVCGQASLPAVEAMLLHGEKMKCPVQFLEGLAHTSYTEAQEGRTIVMDRVDLVLTAARILVTEDGAVLLAEPELLRAALFRSLLHTFSFKKCKPDACSITWLRDPKATFTLPPHDSLPRKLQLFLPKPAYEQCRLPPLPQEKGDSSGSAASSAFTAPNLWASIWLCPHRSKLRVSVSHPSTLPLPRSPLLTSLVVDARVDENWEQWMPDMLTHLDVAQGAEQPPTTTKLWLPPSIRSIHWDSSWDLLRPGASVQLAIPFSPNLTSLALNHERVSLAFVPLPSSLRHLRVPCIKMDNFAQWQLPEGLEQLEVGQQMKVSLAPLRLPSTLRKLTISMSNEVESGKNLPVFPPSLTHIHLGNYWSAALDDVQFPEGLQVLRLPSCFNKPVEALQLPPALTELTFGSSFNQPLKQLILPPALRTLDLSATSCNRDLPQLPAGLLVLKLPLNYSVLPIESLVAQLPPSLTELHSSSSMKGDISLVAAWPPALQRLGICSGEIVMDGMQPPPSLQWLGYRGKNGSKLLLSDALKLKLPKGCVLE